MSSEDPFAIVIRLEPRIRHAIRKICGAARVDDAWSEVVLERIHRIVSLHDETKGNIDGYVLKNLKWYVYKWAHTSTEAKRDKCSVSLNPVNEAHCTDNDNVLELKLILEQLSEYDQWIIKTHAIQGFTIEETAKAANCSRNTARHRYHAAIERARNLVKKRANHGR